MRRLLRNSVGHGGGHAPVLVMHSRQGHAVCVCAGHRVTFGVTGVTRLGGHARGGLYKRPLAAPTPGTALLSAMRLGVSDE